MSFESISPITPRRSVVLGSSGYIGTNVVRMLVARGDDVHEVGRRGSGIEGASFHYAELQSSPSLAAALQEIAPHDVYNLVAPGVAVRDATSAVFVETVNLTVALMDACVLLRPTPHVIHVGSGFEYAEATHPVSETDATFPPNGQYGSSKITASSIVASFGAQLHVTLLRPFQVYGGDERATRLGPSIIAKAMRGEPISLTACAQVRDFVHVDDVSRALISASLFQTSTGIDVYNVATGTGTPLRYFVENLQRVLRTVGLDSNLSFGDLPYRRGDPMYSVADVSKIRRVLDWQARVSLQSGLEDLVERNVQ